MNILVVGMHRSGSSLITAALQCLGFSLGKEFADAPTDDNPKGYFEHPKIREFNERLLGHLDTTWDDLSFSVSDIDFHDQEFIPWKAEASDLIYNIYEGVDNWVAKDPRIASLLPFWSDVFQTLHLPFIPLLVVRDPFEVADSEAMRFTRNPQYHFPLADRDAALAHWCLTLFNLLQSLTTDLLVVSHRDLYQDPRGTLMRCAERLKLNVKPEHLDTFVGQIFDSRLRRAHSLSGSATESAWGRVASQLYSRLMGSAQRFLARDDALTLLSAEPQLGLALEYIKPAGQVFRRVRQIRRQPVDDWSSPGNLRLCLRNSSRQNEKGSTVSKRPTAAETVPVDLNSHQIHLAFSETFFPASPIFLEITHAPCIADITSLRIVDNHHRVVWTCTRDEVTCPQDSHFFWWSHKEHACLGTMISLGNTAHLRLNLPRQVSAQLAMSATLDVEFTAYPVLDRLPQVLQELLGFVRAARTPAGCPADGVEEQSRRIVESLEELLGLANGALDSRDNLISTQSRKLCQLGEELVRAHAQLDFLKDVLADRLREDAA